MPAIRIKERLSGGALVRRGVRGVWRATAHRAQQAVTIPVLGVDAGRAAVKVVEVARAAGRLRLYRAAVVSVERPSAAEAVRRAWRQAGAAAAHRAVWGVASPELIVKPFACPVMPAKELAGAVRLEAEQMILNGHTMHEMAVDWQTLGRTEAHQVYGVIAVVPKTTVSACRTLAAQAGVPLAVLDAQGLALWNAYVQLSAGRTAPGRTVLLLNVGSGSTNLVIAAAPQRLIFMRDVQVGAGTSAEPQAEDWLAEVRDSLHYAKAQHGLRAVDDAVLVGGGATSDMAALVRTALRIPARLWNPLDDLVVDAAVTAPESLGPQLAVAIGLALRQP